MELDELKQAWQRLGRQLERQGELQWQLVREQKLEHVRRGLRSLTLAQVLQMVLGLGLVVLGVACWTRNTGTPVLLASGLLVHAFGVATLALAGMTITLAATIDYAAPVVGIQRQMMRLRCVYLWNAHVCGPPWWIMWLPVTIAFAGLGGIDPTAASPGWAITSLAIGVVGMLATWAWSWRAWRKARARGESDRLESTAIRRGQAALDALAELERD